MRLYNPSEQEYEQLSPHKTISAISESTLSPSTTDFLVDKTLPPNTSETQLYYVANDQTPLTPQAPIQQNTFQKEVRSEKEVKKNTSPVHVSITPKETAAPRWYPETIQTVVTGRYFRDVLWSFPIIIDMDRIEPRGQMYNESITLGSGMKNLPEVSKVLVHEIGHMIDIYAFKKSLKKADISEDFYDISWKDATTIKSGVSQNAFVSGYAATNQYEDFAESFTLYVFHNKEFLKRADSNEYLKRKYNFLKKNIFWNTFTGSSYEKNALPKKIWDVTKIAIKWDSIDTVFAWMTIAPFYKS